MAVHDTNEFDQLFAAYLNGDLTREERARLYALAGPDVARRGALAEVEAVREMFAVESATRVAVLQPVEAAEESDEGFQRLVATAARAEADLRTKLERPALIGGVATRPPPAERRPRVYLLAAAVLLVGGSIGFWFLDQGPGLDSSTPSEHVLGNGIRVTTVVTAAAPRIRWGAHADAKSYDAVIFDARDQVVLSRADPARRQETVWHLSAADLAVLRGHDRLFLRIIARDGSGVEVARTSGAQPLEIR